MIPVSMIERLANELYDGDRVGRILKALENGADSRTAAYYGAISDDVYSYWLEHKSEFRKAAHKSSKAGESIRFETGNDDLDAVLTQAKSLEVPDDSKVAHDVVENFFQEIGFSCVREFPVSVPDKTALGRIDLVVARGALRVAIEIDRRSPAVGSCIKLRQVPDVFRVIFLRGGLYIEALPKGIHAVVPLQTDNGRQLVISNQCKFGELNKFAD